VSEEARKREELNKEAGKLGGEGATRESKGSVDTRKTGRWRRKT
jgi:hypothetical protein